MVQKTFCDICEEVIDCSQEYGDFRYGTGGINDEYYDLCAICGAKVKDYIMNLRGERGAIQLLLRRIRELKRQKTLDEFLIH